MFTGISSLIKFFIFIESTADIKEHFGYVDLLEHIIFAMSVEMDMSGL